MQVSLLRKLVGSTVLALALLAVDPTATAYAQDAGGDASEQNDDNDSGNYGWLGLLGLAA